MASREGPRERGTYAVTLRRLVASKGGAEYLKAVESAYGRFAVDELAAMADLHARSPKLREKTAHFQADCARAARRIVRELDAETRRTPPPAQAAAPTPAPAPVATP